MPRLACTVDLEPHMPLKLKGILMDYGVDQRTFARAIVQRSGHVEGKPMSLTGAADLLNRNVWPALTPRPEIVRQTSEFLLSLGVPADMIRSAFEFDPEDAHHGAHPKGCHTGQHTRAAAPDIDPIETEMLTPQAKKLFSLFRDPFTDDVQGPEDVFLAGEQRRIRETMYSVAKHGGFVAVVGESGSGKTTLRDDLLDRLIREQLPIVTIQPRAIDKGTLTSSAICHAIVDDLYSGTKFPRSLEAQARLVEKMLIESSSAGNTHVLIIEEAHDLNTQTLKYLKRFLEIKHGHKKLLGILLIGQPELKRKLDERVNYDAREVIRRLEIADLFPLDSDVESYLRLKFKRVGGDYNAIFAADAADGIRARLTRPGKTARDTISMVYPLTVNRLVVRAMNLAAELGQPRIDASLIKEI